MKKIVKGFLHTLFELLYSVGVLAIISIFILYQSDVLGKWFPKINCLIDHKARVVYDNKTDGIVKVERIKPDCSCDTAVYKRIKE